MASRTKFSRYFLFTRLIHFFKPETKYLWGDVSLQQAKKLLTLLKTKSKLVRADQYRHRKYALFSAGIIDGKARLRDDGYLVFDSADLEES